MDLAYTIPGVAALIVWLLAAALYCVSWHRVKLGLNRFGDSLVVTGFVMAAGGALWLAWDWRLDPALIRSSLMSGLAVSALVVYAVLRQRRTERVSALVMLVFAIPVQAVALGQLFASGNDASLPETYLPLWMVLRILTGLVGYGGLAMSAMISLLIFILNRTRERLAVDQVAAGIGLRALERKSWQIGLVALSVSISIGLLRSWWGSGQVMAGGTNWMLIAWLLVAASAVGLMQGATRPRVRRALLVVACAVGVISVLTMAGPLVVVS